MTFLEAAIELLRQAGKPLPVQELVDRAIKLGLLSHQGRAPESQMQARLAQELRKGDRSPFLQVEEGIFGLRQYDSPKATAKPEPKPKDATPAAPKSREAAPATQKADSRPAKAAAPLKTPAPVAIVNAEATAEGEAAPAADGEGGKRRRRRRGGRGRNKNKGALAPHPEEGTPEEAIAAERLAAEAEEAEAADDDADTDAPATPIVRGEPPPPAPDLPSEEAMVAPSLPPELRHARAVPSELIAPVRHVEPTKHDAPHKHAEATQHHEAPKHAESPKRHDAPKHAESPRHVEPLTHHEAPKHHEPPTHAEPPKHHEPSKHTEPQKHHEPPKHVDPAEHVDPSKHADPPEPRLESLAHPAFMNPMADPAHANEAAIDLDSFQAPGPRRYPRPVELASEEALASEYADEIGAGAAPQVTGEVVDERTADEDRQLRPEIQAPRDRDRHARRHGHKEDRHKRGGKDRRPEGQPRREPEPARRPDAERATERPPADAEAARSAPRERDRDRDRDRGRDREVDRDREIAAKPFAEGPATGLADIAANLLRSLNDPRPVHVRQLAAMALKRKLATGDPEDLWRAMKAALLADSRARQHAGLRPPVRNQGAGLFVLTVVRLDDALVAAEQALAARADDLRRATREALAKRLRGLAPAVFEQAARVYLERAGFTGVTRVKRAEETWYLAGDLLQGSLTSRVLIAARGGGGELGRRAVGELRAGVEAKGMDRGLLLAPAALGVEATQELDAPGAPIDVFAADALADEMIRAGVGVQRAAMPVAYLDLDFFADLAET